MKSVCYLLLAHLPPGQTDFLVRRWRSYGAAPSQLLLCYGGTRENFEKIGHEPKLFIDDPRLRTRHHQKEKQSYTEVFTRTAAWLKDRPEFEFVYLAEFDHWPVVKDLGERLVERLRQEKADVLGHELARRDGTSCSYYLHHLSDERFLPWLKSISCRADPHVVLNVFGSGSFWTREAFLAVAGIGEPFPMYLEIYLPTTAHHLGFRVRDFLDQNRFISAKGDRYDEQEKARQNGAWTLHPVKTWPASAVPATGEWSRAEPRLFDRPVPAAPRG